LLVFLCQRQSVVALEKYQIILALVARFACLQEKRVAGAKKSYLLVFNLREAVKMFGRG
jgi:hypothetical protein